MTDDKHDGLKYASTPLLLRSLGPGRLYIFVLRLIWENDLQKVLMCIFSNSIAII